MNVCQRCAKKFQYRTGHGMGPSLCNSCNVTKHRHKRKLQLIEMFGGRCETCGYNRCPAALDFHHRDPTTKEFSIAGRGVTRSLAKQIEEAKKCMLLCKNCHSERHWAGDL